MNGVITLSVSCILDHPAPSWRCLWMRIMAPLLGSPRQCFCNVTHWRTVSGLNNFLSESVAFCVQGRLSGNWKTPCSPKASSDHLEPYHHTAPTIILFITDILNIIHVDTILRTFCRPNQLHKLSQLIWSSLNGLICILYMRRPRTVGKIKNTARKLQNRSFYSNSKVHTLTSKQ